MKKQSSVLKKYSVLIITIVMFLLFTSAILGYNYYMSVRTAKESAVVNLISRQSVLVQKMAKEVMNLDVSINRANAQGNTVFLNTEQRQIIEELKASKKLFDETFTALKNGGKATDLDGTSINLDALSDKESQKVLSRMSDVWQPYLNLVNSFLNGIEDSRVNRKSLKFAVDYAAIFNNSLFSETNELINILEGRIRRSAQIVQYIQIGGVIFAFLLFLFIALRSLRQLFRSDKEVAEARQETDDIMATVSEGLFLLDKDLKIGGQYSLNLVSILGQKKIANRSLESLLNTIVAKKDLDVAKNFIELLFDRRKKANLINDLNPLDKVETQIKDDQGPFSTRYLNFNFSRVYDGKEIKKVLVGVSDITEQTKLKKRLEFERTQNEQQMEMLTSILHADMGMLDSFIRHSNECTQKINSILKRPEQSQIDLRSKANEIFVEVHSLKGEASALSLAGFVSIMNTAEETLQKINKKVKITGNDFLPLAVSLDELIVMTGRMEGIIERLGGFAKRQPVTPLVGTDTAIAENTAISGNSSEESQVEEIEAKEGPLTESSEQVLEDYYSRFASEIAERNDKEVKLVTKGLDKLTQNYTKQFDTLKEIIIQLVRNAIVHGIETPQVRKASGKPTNGKLQIVYTEAELSIQDDGQGLQYDKLRQKAVELGLATIEQSQDLQPKQLAAVMFATGVSTAKESNDDAGRGVGLDIVKARVSSLNGKISVHSSQGKGTKFSIKIPITAI